MNATKLAAWRNVTVYDEDGHEIDADGARKLLREYRDTGGMWRAWLADPTEADEYGEIDGVDLSECGLTVDEIDWTGIDIDTV